MRARLDHIGLDVSDYERSKVAFTANNVEAVCHTPV
jgi:hypothetical protein